MLNQKKLLFLFVTTLFSLSAWSSSDVNIMSAKYCNSLVENVRLKNPTRTVQQKIELCSASPYLAEHVKSGKARYVDVFPNHTANSGNYYCSLVSETPKGSSGLKLKKVGLKCGLRTNMHASITERLEETKKLDQANSKEKVEVTSSIYSKNTPKEVLELAIQEAKKDLSAINKISAYFKKRTYNDCSDQMQSQLNDYYDPLKKNVLDRFRFSTSTRITRMHSRYECSPKAYEKVVDSINPDIEDQKYAASTIKPLIEKNIAMYEFYLEEETVVPGVSDESKLFSETAVEVDIDISSVVKTFFHKSSLCAVLKTSETDVYKLECLSKLQDGFKEISWFGGMPKVTHAGICALEPIPDDKKFMTSIREEYKAEGDVFKKDPPTKEYILSNTPKNLNEIALIKCVTDAKSKHIITKKVTTSLKEELKSIIDKVKYSGSTVTEEKLHDIFAADLLKTWKKRYPQIESISMKYAQGKSMMTSSLSIVKPEIFVSEKETCIGYAANVQVEYILTLGHASGISNGFSVAIPFQTRRNAIGDYIYGYKKCFSGGVSGDIALDKDASFLAGLGKRYTNSVPNFGLFNDQKTIQQYQKVSHIDLSSSRTGESELLLLKRENLGGSNSHHYDYMLSAQSPSGVIARKQRTNNYNQQKLGTYRTPYYYSEINKETARAVSSANRLYTNYPMSINYCSSKNLVAGACCFGLTENQNSCDLKPLQQTTAIIAGTSDSGSSGQSGGSNLDFLQNVSAECLAVENKESAACKANMNMVALGFISYMMEQYFQMQTQLMFQNFTASMQAPGADVQSLSQASNAVSLLNTQQQASSMLGLYTQSVTGSPLMPTAPSVTSAMIPLSPVPASLPTNSIFGHAYAATPYGVPFASTQGPGNIGSWLPAGGTYGVARDVASQVATLYSGVNNIAAQRTLLPITSAGRSLNAYPASTISNVSFPQSYYQNNSQVIPTAQNSESTTPSIAQEAEVSASTQAVQASGGTTSKSSLVQIIESLEASNQLRSNNGLKISEISGKVFQNSVTYPSLYLSFNRSAAKEILTGHYSQYHIDLILNKAF